jgi:very-short-patch-repair endonuclease
MSLSATRGIRALDAYFPEHGLIVETDGWDFHKDQEAFEDDRERDADHLDHGFPTVRITRTRFEQSPDYEAARLKRILARLAS